MKAAGFWTPWHRRMVLNCLDLGNIEMFSVKHANIKMANFRVLGPCLILF